MKLTIIQTGAFAVNTALLTFDDARGSWLVDPGADADVLLDAVRSSAAPLTAVLLTHAHFDHIGAIPDLQKAFPDLPVYVHPNDLPAFGHPANQYPPDYPGIATPKNIRDCRSLAGVRTIETPGHTPGGVCYHFPEDGLLLAGDTLFAGSVGRTDLPGGDMKTLTASLGVLKTLPPETHVVPGHGPETTIATEVRTNPFLVS